ncbi:MAG TPA: FkbM family methyltransferase, partial [Acidobacteriaceae bacterium]|nr:FkbM family methyltransferase [Acidobacteriaceae bacterium]
RSTIGRNRFSDVDLIEAGASDHLGQGILHADLLSGSTSSLNNGATFEQRHFGVAPRSIPISLVSIDSLRSKDNRIDFMKIDVEGYEAAALRGAEKSISSDQPVVFIECDHPKHACLDFLESAGYKIVDADRLSAHCSNGSNNFFCFPLHCAESIDTVLALARS